MRPTAWAQSVQADGHSGGAGGAGGRLASYRRVTKLPTKVLVPGGQIVSLPLLSGRGPLYDARYDLRFALSNPVLVTVPLEMKGLLRFEVTRGSAESHGGRTLPSR